MAKLAEPGGVRCGGEVADRPWTDPLAFQRCLNAAEYLVALRDRTSEEWVCGPHARWWAKSGQVIARATPAVPAVETDSMIMRWGTVDEAGRAWERLRTKLLADGHSVFDDGMILQPDGTRRPLPWRAG